LMRGDQRVLTLKLDEQEYFDETTKKFVKLGGIALELEHSLVSLSKWESEFEKPFLSQEPKTQEEALYYIECMIVSGEVPENLLSHLSQENLHEINAYIDSKMSATWFNEGGPQKKSNETITNELIYFWMNSFQIPLECESWHLNRLFNLIRIHSIKNSKPEKVNRQEQLQQQRAENARRREQMGTKG